MRERCRQVRYRPHGTLISKLRALREGAAHCTTAPSTLGAITRTRQSHHRRRPIALRDELLDLWSALGEVPDEEQAALVAQYVDGRTVVAAAAWLHISQHEQTRRVTVGLAILADVLVDRQLR